MAVVIVSAAAALAALPERSTLSTLQSLEEAAQERYGGLRSEVDAGAVPGGRVESELDGLDRTALATEGTLRLSRRLHLAAAQLLARQGNASKGLEQLAAARLRSSSGRLEPAELEGVLHSLLETEAWAEAAQAGLDGGLPERELPPIPPFQHALALELARRGQTDAAIARLRQVASRPEACPDCLYQLDRLGADCQGAERCLELFPAHWLARRRVEGLEALQPLGSIAGLAEILKAHIEPQPPRLQGWRLESTSWQAGGGGLPAVPREGWCTLELELLGLIARPARKLPLLIQRADGGGRQPVASIELPELPLEQVGGVQTLVQTVRLPRFDTLGPAQLVADTGSADVPLGQFRSVPALRSVQLGGSEPCLEALYLRSDEGLELTVPPARSSGSASLVVISALDSAAAIPQGDVVAELTPAGQEPIALRAGVHTADTWLAAPGMRARHGAAPIESLQDTGRGFQAARYRATFRLQRRPQRLRVEARLRRGYLHLYGLCLAD
jgi:hypothetical protein